MKAIAAVLALMGTVFGASMAVVLDQAHEQRVAEQHAGHDADRCVRPRGHNACPRQPAAPKPELPPPSSLFALAPAEQLPPPPSSAPAPTTSAALRSAAPASTVPAPSSPRSVTPPGPAGSAGSAGSAGVRPDGVPAALVGSLVLNESAAGIWNAWDHSSLAGADCETPGTVALSSSVLDLTTNGKAGNCAKITSKTTYRFGIYEARIWVEAGPNGTIANWPAFWMVGPNWPVGGEIDAFEALGGYDSASFHYGADNSYLTKRDTALKPGWNVVDVVWKPRLLAVYYNGRKFVEWDSPVITSQPMWVTFDNTTGRAGYTTGRPSTMRVDYLRIWQAA